VGGERRGKEKDGRVEGCRDEVICEGGEERINEGIGERGRGE